MGGAFLSGSGVVTSKWISGIAIEAASNLPSVSAVARLQGEVTRACRSLLESVEARTSMRGIAIFAPPKAKVMLSKATSSAAWAGAMKLDAHQLVELEGEKMIAAAGAAAASPNPKIQ